MRDVGTYLAWTDRALRDEINAGHTSGPRMQVAGYYLTIPGGGGDLVIPGHPASDIPGIARMGVARGPDEFRRKADAAVAGGAGFLKVIASGAVLAYGGGNYIDTVGRTQGWPEEFLRKNLETIEAQRQAFSRALAAGAPIVYGTDAAVYPHGLNARQFEIMVQRGMGTMAAIQSATSVAARHLGWDDRVGSLAPGRYGDLVAVEGDPLQDVRRLQDVAVVIKGGIVVRRPRRK